MTDGRRTTTLVLVATLVLAYSLTVWLGGHSAFSRIDTLDLVALGGASGMLIGSEHEFWRIFTAPLLHASPQHLMVNLAILILVGYPLEHRIGSAWTATAAIISGLTGILFAVEANAAYAVSVGASGIACGLLVVNLIALMHEQRRWRRLIEIFITFFALIAAMTPASDLDQGSATDIAAHFGGAMAGLCCSFALWQAWPPESAEPPLLKPVRWIAWAGCPAILLAIAITGYKSSTYLDRFAAYAGRTDLVAAAESQAHLKTLAELYPDDPRAQLGMVGFDIQTRDYDDARTRLDRILNNPNVLRDFGPTVILKTTVLLSYVHLIAGHIQEAEKIAQPVCPYIALDSALKNIHQDLIDKRICPEKEKSR